ncbi:MAG TPA: class I adenylate-forming enzyme family protein [Candidatus Eremiobacteraceae bacterium]|nr:class I adenylate-forming enzyme family protein [Candidatus Eremiobacteraceae bacterium]
MGLTGGLTAIDAIEARAAQDPARTALICPDEHAELTYADLATRAKAAASVFSNAGMERAKKLAVMMASGARYATCLFGAWRLGAVVVPVDPMLKGPDARDLINAAKPVALAIDDRRLLELCGLLDECRSLKAVFTAGTASDDRRFHDFDAAMASSQIAADDRGSGEPSDIAIEGYRFHTDDLKVVPRTHEALSRDAATLAQRLSLTHEDRGICAIPLGHSDGLTSLVAAVTSASRLVIPERFDARHFWELVAAQRATWRALVPTQFLDLQFAGPPAQGVLGQLRAVMIAGKAVMSKAQQQFAEKFGVRVVTETTV